MMVVRLPLKLKLVNLALSSAFCMPLSALTACAVLMSGSPLAQAAASKQQVRLVKDTRAVDLGVAPANAVKTITLGLNVMNPAALEAHIAATVDPKNSNFKKFITPAQFASLYGQSNDTINQLVSYLNTQGIKVTKVYPNNLLISAQATNAQIAAVFGISIHNFSMSGLKYQAPAGSLKLPSQLSGVVRNIAGLSTKPLMRNHAITLPKTGPSSLEAKAYGVRPKLSSSGASNTPGWYNTSDVANQYNINPLYNAGISGSGKTIGIATLAGYNQSDVFAYWKELGLNVDPDRITDVAVDGGYAEGDGPGSEGAGETTLDVEQSGGIAPGAKIRVYIAPNTDAGFLDVFATAVNENLVDTLSISWGGIEIGGYDVDSFHTVFAQAALQGIPVIAASGDSGAYDINRNPGPFTYPENCTTLLGVDYPAADPLVLAAGGTTLPGVYHRSKGDVIVPAERPWGWDYLRDYTVKNYGQAVYYSSYFPVGGGGGVSLIFERPEYQNNLPGVMKSAGAQSLFCSPAVTSSKSWQDLFDAPAGFAGRNLPDVSLNADPVSGLSVYVNGGWSAGSGGTSFVSPQLNGIFTLISASVNGRLGWLQPQLYGMFKAQGYSATSPFKPVTSGSNLFYQGGMNYNPASGLGALNVEQLARSFGAKL